MKHDAAFAPYARAALDAYAERARGVWYLTALQAVRRPVWRAISHLERRHPDFWTSRRMKAIGALLMGASAAALLYGLVGLLAG